jgi:serine/threonine protein kinase
MAVRGDELQRGSVVGGYRIDELIGRGGMGLVYRATNVALNRIYALKVLSPALAEDEQFRERFKREMRIAASLHHPNIVGIHYAGEHDGMLFFVMDYVTGTDLRDIIVRDGAIEPRRAVDLLEQCASALDAAHARGLVHRDVKPANIMITVKDGEEHAYLTDFGLAKKFDTVSGLTVKGSVVGTVDYMAPEQITGDRTDARTDIYALGCVFYQMLTGNVPFERDNSVATLFAHVHHAPPPLAGGVSETHPAFAAVLTKAMAKEPSERYFSAGDFARDAAAALKGSRDTGPPTIVGTGDATPLPVARPVSDAPSEPVPEPSGLVELREATATGDVAGETAVSPPPATTPPPETPSDPDATSLTPTPEPDATSLTPTPEPDATSLSPVPESAPPPETRPPSEPPPPSVPSSLPPAAAAPPPPPPAEKKKRSRVPMFAGLFLVLAAAVAAVIVLTSGGSSTPKGEPFAATADPVPTNQVTGNGSATVRLNGDQVTVNLDTNGLLNGSPHAMHIHAGGKGICPPASAARLHNGHLSISTTNGIAFYGPPQVSLTSHGDTSSKSIVDFSRYPSVGDIRYTRTFAIPPGVAAAIRAGNAVIVVHGIDYNHNGIYDDVLDRSELNKNLPAEATAPALCGPLVASKSADAGTAGTSYTVDLHRYVASIVQVGNSFELVCHLVGVDTGALADPRSVSATGVAPA